MTPDPRTEEIRTRLAAATPGPWEVVPTVGNAIVSPDGDGYWTDVADRIDNEADAVLIANAPADLAYLLGRIEALENVADAAREAVAIKDESIADPSSPGLYERHIANLARVRAALAALDGQS